MSKISSYVGEELEFFGSWLLRLVCTITVAVFWAAVVICATAMVLPGKIDPDLSRNLSSKTTLQLANADAVGVDAGFIGLHQILGIATVLYFIPMIIFVLPKFEEQDRMTWFCWSAAGWVTTLLFMLGMFFNNGLLSISSRLEPMYLAPNIAGYIILGFFGACLILTLAFGTTLGRIVGTIALVLAGLRCASAVIPMSFMTDLQTKLPESLQNLPLLASNAPMTGVSLSILFAVSALVGLIVVALSVGSEADARFHQLGLALLVWGFVVALLLALGVVWGDITMPIPRSREMWNAILFALLASPAFGWLGTPFTRDRRVGWAVLVGLVAILVGVAIDGVSVDQQRTETLLSHVHQNYNGPHIMDHSWLVSYGD